MNLIESLRSRRHERKSEAAARKFLEQFSGLADEIAASRWLESLGDPTSFYKRCFHYYHTRLPESLRDHRTYFESGARGFGEKTFHVMWFLLFREFPLESFLEIGVYRGQTISLVSLLASYFQRDVFIQGISPFSSAGDAVSKYRNNLDYYRDTLENFAHFSLPAPALLKAYSTDAAAAELIGSRDWACIYIDGCHDYEIARHDWELASMHVRPGGIIVLDDSGLTTSYTPAQVLATGGHPGPSRLAQEIDRTRFREILQVGYNRVFQKIA